MRETDSNPRNTMKIISTDAVVKERGSDNVILSQSTLIVDNGDGTINIGHAVHSTDSMHITSMVIDPLHEGWIVIL